MRQLTKKQKKILDNYTNALRLVVFHTGFY